MGLEDRDWFREESQRPRGAGGQKRSRSNTGRRPPSASRSGGGSWFKLFIVSSLVVGLLWVWGYHEDVPIAVTAWKAVGTAYNRTETLLHDSSDEVPSAAPYSRATVEAAIEATVQAKLATKDAAPYSRATVEAAIEATVQAKLGTEGALPATNTPTPSPPPTRTPAIAPIPTPTSASLVVPKPKDDLKQVGSMQLNADDIEKFVIEFTNKERVRAGLSEFVHDQAISDIARSHSKNMALIGYGHVVNGKDPTDRALEAGYDCKGWTSSTSYTHGLAENIFRLPRVARWSGTRWGNGPTRWSPSEYAEDSREMAKLLVDGWMDSSGHKKNILDKSSRRIGVGVNILATEKYGYVHEEAYATQNFSGCK